ncbi:MAG: EFR1 family ferrodoxin [Firmicutes bacterium]|nr:EFR1 family ferrodoxin [Bacillota bacterium]
MILYFSGTGNSEYVAKRIAEHVDDKALNLFQRIREDDYTSLESQKPWVVVAPTYAWQLPRLVRDYLKKTKLEGNKKVYYVLTCGSSIGGAGKYAEALTGEIGMEYMGCAPIVMPENYIAMFNVPDMEESVKIISKASRKIKRLSLKIIDDKPFKAKRGGKLASSIINKAFYTFVLKDKKFMTLESCNACGKCVNVCPLKNIELKDGQVKWKGNCTHCMACICKCPQEAIEYGSKSAGKWRYNCPVK